MIANVRKALAPCREVGGHRFSYLRAAQLRETLEAGSGCEAASLLRCEVIDCWTTIVAACRRSNPDRCSPCSILYGDRVRRVARSGAMLVLPGQTVLLTLTAPSQSSTPHLYRGQVCPCYARQGGPVKADVWNGEEAQNWNRFITYLRRFFGDQLEYFCGVETQKRGLLHRHVILRGDFASLVIDAEMRAEIKAMAIQWGYGHEIDWQVLEQGRDAARYVTKYVAKASADRPSVPWFRPLKEGSAAHRQAVKSGRPLYSFRPTYRLWTCSRFWGASMRDVSAWQTHYSAVVSRLPAWADADGAPLREVGPLWANLAPDWSPPV